MKICFFDFITLVGGATKGTVFLLERLKKQGIDAEVINAYGTCLEYLDDLKGSKIDYTILIDEIEKTTIGFSDNRLRRLFEIFMQIPIFLIIFKNLFLTLFRIKPSHVMVNNRKSLLFILPFKFIFKFKVIYYNRIELNKSQLSKILIFCMNNFVDYLLSHSKNAILNMKKYGITKKALYLPNCVKINPKLLVKKSKKIDSNTFEIFLNAGRIVREKGYHTAIYAVNELKRRQYNVVLKLPGIVTDQDYFEELMLFLSQNNLTETVKFCGWLDEVQQEIFNSDCMILPSYSEGFPRSIIEAMLLKVPICATPVGGITEAIIDSQTGFLFDVNDFISMADKIEILITQNETRKNIVNNAYLFALQHFDESLNTEFFINNVDLND